MEDIWSTRDLPVFKAIVDLFDEQGTSSIRATDIERRTGFDEDTVQRAIRALYAEPYLQEDGSTELSDNTTAFVGAPTGEALRVAGMWPSPQGLLDRLVTALELAAEEDTRESDERSKFKQTALWLRGAASQVAISALGGAAGNMLS